VRYKFPDIFPTHQDDCELDLFNVKEGTRLIKINYQCNMLTAMSEHCGRLMDVIADSDEMSIFQSDVIIDVIDFKWNKFAKNVH
jgi:hypothetical protein